MNPNECPVKADGPSTKKSKGTSAPTTVKAQKTKPSHLFDNPTRIAALYEEITAEKPLNEIKDGMIKIMQAKNKDLLKKLFAGRVEELSPDVDLYTFAGGSEVIVKSFVWEGEFGGAFQEIAGGVCTTQYVNIGESENFCRVYDIFIAKDTLFMLFEKLTGDIEKEFNSPEHPESLEDPAVMFNLLFQLSMAMAKMQNKNELVHFDVRHDNVQVQWLDEPRVLYPRYPYETNFVIKLIDFGQCELKVGTERPINDDVVHGDDEVAKWGTFPEEFCPGYDMQYFLYTLVDVLEGFLAQYYVLDAVLGFIDEGIETEANKTPQSRPFKVSKKNAKQVREFLWKECKAMV